MFGGGGHGHQQQPQNVPSDSSHYRAQYNRAHCDKYLCPDTLGGCPFHDPMGKRTSANQPLVGSMCAFPTPLSVRVAVTRRQV
jgi:hypothetical protein